jgi:hypothetical protein
MPVHPPQFSLNNEVTPNTYYEFRCDSWVNQSLSKGSIAFGDYEERALNPSMSVMIDSSYSSIATSSRYQELKKLIDSWLNDQSDHDRRFWPEIERIIAHSKIKFREPFD